MLKSGIINSQLLANLANLRHTDLLVIADAGLPVPRDVPTVDLAFTYGIPRFEAVLGAIVKEIAVEGALIAQEARDTEAERWVTENLGLSSGKLLSFYEAERWAEGTLGISYDLSDKILSSYEAKRKISPHSPGYNADGIPTLDKDDGLPHGAEVGWRKGSIAAPLLYAAHVDFKDLVRHASFVVRTGEDTPYANVILRAGVPF